MCFDLTFEKKMRVPSDSDGCDGFTFIELLVIVAVSAVAIAGIVMGLHEGVESLLLQEDLRSATVLSADLMHEIRTKDFADSFTPGPDRRNFDDVGDYSGWTKSPPETIEGLVMTHYGGFTRSVTVANVLADLVTPGSTNAGFKRITVVASSAGVTVSNVSAVSEYDD